MSTTEAIPGTKIVYEGDRGRIVLGVIVSFYTDRYGMERIKWRCTKSEGWTHVRDMFYHDLATWVHPRKGFRVGPDGHYRVVLTRWIAPKEFCSVA